MGVRLHGNFKISTKLKGNSEEFKENHVISSGNPMMKLREHSSSEKKLWKDSTSPGNRLRGFGTSDKKALPRCKG